MIDRVGNRGRNADDADLAQPFDAKRIDDLVRLIDKNDFYVVYVGIHRYVVSFDL